MINKGMTGTSWHIGYGDKKQDDRRHKSKCIYYNKGHCTFLCSSCVGSSHCDNYRTTKVFVDEKDIEKFALLSNKAAQIIKNKEEEKKELKELKQQELTQKRDMYSISIIYSGENKSLFKILRRYLYRNSFLLNKSSRKSGLYQGELLYREVSALFKGSINKKSMILLFLECFKMNEYDIEFDLNKFEDKLKRISNFNLLKYGAVN